MDARLAAVAAFQSPAHVGHAQAVAADRSGLGVQGIFDGDAEPAIVNFLNQPNGSSLRQIADTVDDSIFNQWLENQRRNEQGL